MFISNLVKQHAQNNEVRLPSITKEVSPAKASEASPIKLSPPKKKLDDKNSFKLISNDISPALSSKKKRSLEVPQIEEIMINEVTLDQLEQSPAPKEKNINNFFRKNLNILVPGRCIDSEQHMLQEFVRKSKELEKTVKDVLKQKKMTSVGGAYMQAQEALREIRVKSKFQK